MSDKIQYTIKRLVDTRHRQLKKLGRLAEDLKQGKTPDAVTEKRAAWLVGQIKEADELLKDMGVTVNTSAAGSSWSEK
jgi:hypothetical protein